MGILTYIIPFVILLGILVFVHEAGHFTVAKLFKIKVEKFSIGFGPRIFGWKRGDTEYRVSWIPLGGYVKMAGDDPTDDEAKNQPGSFLGADLWKRMLVVLAGPGVNLILPIFVVAGIYMNGKETWSPHIGAVKVGSPAAAAGLTRGDSVVAVDGTHVESWLKLKRAISSKEGSRRLTVKRGDETFEITLTPRMQEQEDDFGIKRMTPIIGITPEGVRPVIAPASGSPAAAAGVKLGDVIAKINGQPVDFWFEADRVLARLEPGPVTLHLLRYKPIPADPELQRAAERAPPEEIDLTLTATEKPSRESLGLGTAELVVREVEASSPAEKAGLQAGDQFVRGGDRVFADYSDFSFWLEDQLKLPELKLTVLREGREQDLTIAPHRTMERIKGTSRMQETLWLGFEKNLYAKTTVKTFTIQYKNPFTALGAGAAGTWEIIAMNGRAVGKIFTRELSLRESLGGPVAIAESTAVAVDSAGLDGFLWMLINMSVILGIMNLLPIPVLDGGHLAFFTVEAVMRRAPSLRVREVAQQAGLLFLLAIMAFVLVNDVIVRLF